MYVPHILYILGRNVFIFLITFYVIYGTPTRESVCVSLINGDFCFNQSEPSIVILLIVC